MTAKVLIKYTIKNVCNPDDFGPGQRFKTFADLVLDLIENEGITGIAEDKFYVISIQKTPKH